MYFRNLNADFCRTSCDTIEIGDAFRRPYGFLRECFHALAQGGVFELSRLVKSFERAADRDLIRKHERTDAAENGPNVNQTAHAPQTSGRSAVEAHHFILERSQRF